jgi:hypothetical protein
MASKEELEKILKLKISELSETRLCSLWAGYGSIRALEIITASGQTIHLICKIIEPPGSSGSGKGQRANHESEEHQRKLRSYLVEEEFYRVISPSLQSSGHGIAQYFYSTKQSDGRVRILMEDLRDSHPLSLSSLSLTDQAGACHAALDWLARFHAHHWEQSNLWESWGCGLRTGGNGDGNGFTSEEASSGIWPEGCYWRLDTRLEEFSSMNAKRYQRLKRVASPLAELLRDGIDSSCPQRHRTVIHGDFKIANLLFSQQPQPAAVGPPLAYHCVSYDFQYLGLGYGVRDLVMLFVSSVDLPTSPSAAEMRKRRSSSPASSTDLLSSWKEIERVFLEYYHAELLRAIEENLTQGLYQQDLTDTTPSASRYPYSLLLFHYELALVDYMRFMAGWGLWGNTNYIEQRVEEILHRLDQGRALQPEEYRTALIRRYREAETL